LRIRGELSSKGATFTDVAPACSALALAMAGSCHKACEQATEWVCCLENGVRVRGGEQRSIRPKQGAGWPPSTPAASPRPLPRPARCLAQPEEDEDEDVSTADVPPSDARRLSSTAAAFSSTD
jgi:hypothetical protein